MKILVSELSKLYGISNQTLHYYEDKKILKPSRDVLNNYRYYDTNDLRRLGAIKKYRNAGFSMKMALEMCNEDNDEELIRKLSTHKEKLKKSIERKQLLVNQIDEDLKLYTRAKDTPDKYLIERLDAFYMLVSYGKEIVFQSPNFREEGTWWFENIFFTNASRMFHLDKVSGKIYQEGYGMLASEIVASYMGLKVTENVVKIEGGLFVTSTFTADNDDGITERIDACLHYIEDQNFSVRGNPFIKTVFASKNEKNAYKLLMQLLVPIREI